MRLVQFKALDGTRRVGAVSDDGQTLRVLGDTLRVYDLALEADQRGRRLADLVTERAGAEEVDYAQVVDDNRLLLPLDHPDPAHCLVSGTGLDHLGSAQARDAMQAVARHSSRR